MPIDILLADDDPGDVCLVQEALRRSELASRLHVVRDGVDLLAFLRREGGYAAAPRPDLILLDLNMPRKGGTEALSELKSDDRIKSIPVVIFTTSTAGDDVARSYALHASCYVAKPAELHQFIETVLSIQQFWRHVVTLPPR